MRNTVLRSALNNKKEISKIFQNEDYKKTLDKAKEMWIEFKPNKQACKIIGIDSSFVTKNYQGMSLYAIDVFASDENGEKIFEDAETNITNQEQSVGSLAAEFEMKALEESIGKADFVLMDGSILSHNFRTKQDEDRIVSILDVNPNVLFISKNSNSSVQFNSTFGDMTYFNHVSNKSGMTEILKTTTSRFSKDFTVSYVYARLADSTQLLKIEKFGEEHSVEEFRECINKISYKSKHGYPYALRLAHDYCKIHKSSLNEIAGIFNVKNEIGAREAVSE